MDELAPDLRVELPVPPSANNLFVTRRFGKGRAISPAYEAWIKDAGWAIKLWPGGVPKRCKHCRVEMEMPVTYQRDLDNCAKPILDLLVAHEVLVDDRYVEDLRVRRTKGTRATVSVWRL